MNKADIIRLNEYLQEEYGVYGDLGYVDMQKRSWNISVIPVSTLPTAPVNTSCLLTHSIYWDCYDSSDLQVCFYCVHPESNHCKRMITANYDEAVIYLNRYAAQILDYIAGNWAKRIRVLNWRDRLFYSQCFNLEEIVALSGDLFEEMCHETFMKNILNSQPLRRMVAQKLVNNFSWVYAYPDGRTSFIKASPDDFIRVSIPARETKLQKMERIRHEAAIEKAETEIVEGKRVCGKER